MAAAAAIAVAAVVLLRSGSGHSNADPATYAGRRPRLVDADPCRWNGDSGCNGVAALRRREATTCLARGGTFDAGAPAASVQAAAGHWIQAGRHQGLARRGRVTLRTKRLTARRYAVRAPSAVPRSADAVWFVVRYRAGVTTSYRSGTEGAQDEPFHRGTYALRLARCRGR